MTDWVWEWKGGMDHIGHSKKLGHLWGWCWHWSVFRVTLLFLVSSTSTLISVPILSWAPEWECVNKSFLRSFTILFCNISATWFSKILRWCQIFWILCFHITVITEKGPHYDEFLNIACVWHEKWKWSRSVVSDSSQPHGLQAPQAPPSMGFSRQECWNGVPLQP